MTQDEARSIAEAAASRLWGISVPLRMWRYRRWLVVGPVRWEAVGSSESRDVRLELDDDTREVLLARIARRGSSEAQPTSQRLEQATGLLVILALGGLSMAIGDVVPKRIAWLVAPLFVIALMLGTLVWVRVRIMQRRG